MTRKYIAEDRIEPSLPAERAKELIKKQIGEIDSLLQLQYNDPEVRKWDNITEQILLKTFGKPHNNHHDFNAARYGGAFIVPRDDYELQADFKEGLLKCKKLLEGFIEQLDMFSPPDTTEPVVTKESILPLSKKIFIVHGHADQAKSELALILTNLGLEPIILHEKASEGMTLIEKLEKHSEVGFAFILLTPDDVGASIGNKDNLKPRARQNVVFEFGMFVGKIKRNRVCCLYTGNVELPSDLKGLNYLPFQSSVNELFLQIVKELRAAGYEISI